jgi:carbonic anhydrase
MKKVQKLLALSAWFITGCVAAVDDQAATANNELSEILDEHGECPSGVDQSPIDLPARPMISDLEDLTFDYEDTHVAISNTGKTVQYSYDPGSVLLVGDARYELMQFHFHAHSEHAVAGTLLPMELHLVHKNQAGQLLVVGVFIVTGDHNPTFDLANWPELPSASDGALDIPTATFNASELVPDGPTYRYLGSLTAPPCSGDVSWIVFQRPITLDTAQIAMFTRLYSHNVRPLQPLGDRRLTFGE